jgi:hypothetical protein
MIGFSLIQIFYIYEEIIIKIMPRIFQKKVNHIY